MTGLDVLLAVAGLAATALVVAGMILLTPRGTADVSRADTPRAPHTAARSPETQVERLVSTGRAPDDR